MIHIDCIDDSRAELRLVVKSRPSATIPPKIEEAPDLLVSALRGRLRVLLPTLETPPPAEPHVAPRAAISAIDRLHNPLYNMFGQKRAFPAI